MEVKLLCLAKERLNLGRTRFDRDLEGYGMADKNQMERTDFRRIEDAQRDTRVTTHVLVREVDLAGIVHVWLNVTGPQNSCKVDKQRRIGNISTDTNPARIGLARWIGNL